MSYSTTSTQDNLLLQNLMRFYDEREHLTRIMDIISGKSNISLRIVDWFVTNYAKKYYTQYYLPVITGILRNSVEDTKFKVYDRYKLQLKAYSKKRFDPFCRWDRISIPYEEDKYIETTIGQLNFFKWAIENRILEYIQDNYGEIEADMNTRNSTASSKANKPALSNMDNKTRKKRQELSLSACKCIKKEHVRIIVRFND